MSIKLLALSLQASQEHSQTKTTWQAQNYSSTESEGKIVSSDFFVQGQTYNSSVTQYIQ